MIYSRQNFIAEILCRYISSIQDLVFNPLQVTEPLLAASLSPTDLRAEIEVK